ncbi:MAG: hypothetical protein ABSD75_03850 [Terriglobales bacterium]|jgi:hypothetical protein
MKRSTGIAFIALALTAVISFAALPASASSTTYDFHFLSTGGGEYCDGIFFYNYGSPKTLVDGYHWNTFCAGTNANVNGFKASVAANYQYAATGAAFLISDPDSGNGAGGGTGVMWLINPTYHTWNFYYSGGGAGEYVGNEGIFVNGEALVTHGSKSTKSAQSR